MSGASDSLDQRQTVAQLLTERFRCPEEIAEFVVSDNLSPEFGYFGLGSGLICYGQCTPPAPSRRATTALHDLGEQIAVQGTSVHLPFDPVQVVDCLRLERYHSSWQGVKRLPWLGTFRSVYYLLRPLMAVSLRKYFQKLYFRGWDKLDFPRWPVDITVEELLERLLTLSMSSQKIEKLPFIWFWPDGAPSCTMMTHDVETSAGRDFCTHLMDLNDSFGIKSSFQVVPEKRYAVSRAWLDNIHRRGFEVNVHDLNHDGKLMSERAEFLRRAKKINSYGKEFGALGFRSAIMYRNTDWYHALDFSYDMSVPNMAHLEPQQGGCCTVMPYFIGNILELPLTTTQDYSLFNILNEYSIRLWKEQVAIIRAKHGLISFIVHPDYNIDPAPRRIYAELLKYLSELRSQGETWIALPGEIALWWRQRNQMRLVKVGDSWRIEGEGSERARLAYAVLEDGKLTYTLDEKNVGYSSHGTPQSCNS